MNKKIILILLFFPLISYATIVEGLWEMNLACNELQALKLTGLTKAKSYCDDSSIYNEKYELYNAANLIIDELELVQNTVTDSFISNQIKDLLSRFEDVQLILLNDDDH